MATVFQFCLRLFVLKNFVPCIIRKIKLASLIMVKLLPCKITNNTLQ